METERSRYQHQPLHTHLHGRSACHPSMAFWSVTIVRRKTQLLIDNPINPVSIKLRDAAQAEKGTRPAHSPSTSKRFHRAGRGKPTAGQPPNGPNLCWSCALTWPKESALKGSWPTASLAAGRCESGQSHGPRLPVSGPRWKNIPSGHGASSTERRSR